MALQTLDIGNNFASNLAKNFDCYGIQLKVNDVYKFSYDKSLWKLEINNVETDEFYIYAMCESSLVTGINYTDFVLKFYSSVIENIESIPSINLKITAPVINTTTNEIIQNTLQYSLNKHLGCYMKSPHPSTGTFSGVYGSHIYDASYTSDFYDHAPQFDYYDFSCRETQDGTFEVLIGVVDEYSLNSNFTSYTISVPVTMLDDDSISTFGNTFTTNSLGKQSVKCLEGTIKHIKFQGYDSNSITHDFYADLYFPIGEESRELITNYDDQFKLQYVRAISCQDGSISGSLTLPNDYAPYRIYVVFE